jgi:hypothetical protein
MFNISNYGHTRSHHYHFFLEDFPRVEGQPTYALDTENLYGFTYSQEDKLYKGQRLGDIINRVVFAIPPSDADKNYFVERKSGSSHNDAQRLLWNN